MRSELLWLLISSLFFAGGILSVVLGLRAGRYERSRWNIIVMAGGFLGQCVFLYQRGEQIGRCPITNPSEILVFVAWSAVLLYFIVGRAFRLSLLGMFTAPLALLFQVVAFPNLGGTPVYNPAGDFWLELHASISLLAYGAFALAAIAGVMFLLQDRMLRSGNLEGLSYNLPPVTNLTHSIFRLVGIGLLLLTVGILCGFGMERPPSGVHLFSSVLVWLLYAALWGLRQWGSLPNSRMAWSVIGGYLLPILTLGLMEH